MTRISRYGSILIAAALALAAVFVSLPSSAQQLSGPAPAQHGLKPMTLTFRGTSQGGMPATRQWASSNGFVDSTVFRHASALPTSYDTTISYPIAAMFPYPPTFGPAYIPSIADTLFPWISIKFSQDTTSYSFSGTSGMDSVRVGLEFSDDNVNWFGCANGTPTYRFDTVFFTSGADGLQNPSLIGVELLGGMDTATIPIKARLNGYNGATAMIPNQPFPAQYKYVRFLFGGDFIGQFKAEVLRWLPGED